MQQYARRMVNKQERLTHGCMHAAAAQHSSMHACCSNLLGLGYDMLVTLRRSTYCYITNGHTAMPHKKQWGHWSQLHGLVAPRPTCAEPADCQADVQPRVVHLSSCCCTHAAPAPPQGSGLLHTQGPSPGSAGLVAAGSQHEAPCTESVFPKRYACNLVRCQPLLSQNTSCCIQVPPDQGPPSHSPT